MKLRYLLLGAASSVIVALTAQPGEAQVYTSFTNTMKNKPYVENTGTGKVVLASNSFVDPTTKDIDRDNGFWYNSASKTFAYQIGFSFEYDGFLYQNIYININGFVSFGPAPLRLGAEIPTNLFNNQPPNAVVAPYWGNHYYRDPANDANSLGFVPSEISVQVSGTAPNRVFTVEWKKLNINYFFDPADPNNPLSPNASAQRSSVGSFQVKLYESPVIGQSKVNDQGNIEFYYSVVGDPSAPGIIKTSGAAIGIESHAPNTSGATSFMNGLFIEDPTFGGLSGRTSQDTQDNVRNNTMLTSTWSPSRANNNIITFVSTPRPGVAGWGDGDANLSQLSPQHLGKPQLIYTTASDAIMIMRAAARNIPLTNLINGQAYHGDVNHNGRYYYSTRNLANSGDSVYHRRNVPTRSVNEFDDLPADNSRSSLYFETTEYDAAIILNFTAGKVPKLPWLLDNFPDRGKAGIEVSASNVEIAGMTQIGVNTFEVPVYLNGNINGPLGFSMNISGDILAVRTNGKLNADFDGNRVVFAGSDDFKAGEPIAYVTIRTEDAFVNLTNIRFNDEVKGNIKLMLNGSGVNVGDILSQNTPNPVSLNTIIPVNVSVAGEYVLAIYDAMGNKVKTIANTWMNEGSTSFSWDTTDEFGVKVSSGIYIYRLEGQGALISKKLSVVR